MAEYHAGRTLYALERARECQDQRWQAGARLEAEAAASELRQARKALLALPCEHALQRHEARCAARRRRR